MRPHNLPTLAGLGLVAFWLFVIVSGFGTPNGWIVRDDTGLPISGDYTGIYTAGALALKGEPLSAYDWDIHRAAQKTLTGDPDADFYPWPYPPTFLFAAGALAMLPYLYSMLVWTLGTLAAFGAALYAISRRRGDFLMLLGAPALWLNFYIGQNGALTGALLGLGLVALPTRPVVAGIFLGLLSYKPHLGLLLPIALAAGGYWRTFMACAATVVALVVAATLAFGVDPWVALPEQMSRVFALVKSAADIEKIQTLFGFSRAIGLNVPAAMSLQVALAVSLAIAVGWVWLRRDVDYDLKAALLAAAMTLTSPYQFVYDLVMLTVSQAFILRHAAGSAWSLQREEVYALILANFLIFMFAGVPVPLGFVGCLIVLVVAAARVHRVLTARQIASASGALTVAG